MTVSCEALARVDRAIRVVCHELGSREEETWEARSEDELWRELVWCILGSRVSWEATRAAVDRLERDRLLEVEEWKGRFVECERRTMRALAVGYRFHRQGSARIRAAAERIYCEGGSLRALLGDGGGRRSVRRVLVGDVPGLGPKQASLFLRSIGFAPHMAVLDRHVLTYLHWSGITDAALSTVPSLRRYEELEGIFLAHAESQGFTPTTFDLAVWLVVRTAKRELGEWAS